MKKLTTVLLLVLMSFVLVIGCAPQQTQDAAPSQDADEQTPPQEEVQEPEEQQVFCSDSDGGNNVLESGATTKGEMSERDECLGTKKVVEYYCQANEITSAIADCPDGHSCSEGECVSDSQNEQTQLSENEQNMPEECADSDGGKDSTMQGTTTKGSTAQTDSCDGANVVEHYCENNEVMSETIVCGVGKTCSEGKCVTESLEAMPGPSNPQEEEDPGIQIPSGEIQVLGCSDSDDGKDYMTKGTTTKGLTSEEDTCFFTGIPPNTIKKLTEYYCEDGVIKSEVVTCSSCSAGVCVQS